MPLSGEVIVWEYFNQLFLFLCSSEFWMVIGLICFAFVGAIFVGRFSTVEKVTLSENLLCSQCKKNTVETYMYPIGSAYFDDLLYERCKNPNCI